MEGLVAIARVVRPRGLKGEVVADTLTDFPERFGSLKNVVAVSPQGEERKLTVNDLWFQKDRIVLRFEGIDSVEKAGRLRDAEICIPETDAVALGDDEFFDWQLVGCEVLTADGERLGLVSGVMRTGGTDNIVVAGAQKEYLVPFAVSICVEVDLKNKKIVVDPPDGLLEF